jgi:2-oxoglutarate ferredoxin oxidoreductase subunit gamma
MQEDIIMAGFGGQGIMTMGQLLAYAGLKESKNVLWMPAYGPETRGGFANCTVIFSDAEIGSPVVSQPKYLIVLNNPSLDKFENSVLPQGFLFVNTSLVNRNVVREDIKVIKMPASDIANELGNAKVTNIIALGAFIEKTKLVKLETVKKILQEKFKGRESIIEMNLQAIEKGAEIIRKNN